MAQLTAVDAHVRGLELMNEDGEISSAEQEGEYCHSAIPGILKADMSIRPDAQEAGSLAPLGFFGFFTFQKSAWEQHFWAELNVESNAATWLWTI